jgi:hypothetical protein
MQHMSYNFDSMSMACTPYTELVLWLSPINERLLQCWLTYENIFNVIL